MLRSALSVVLLAFALQAAQAQFHGVPASATSPTTNRDGGVVLHGVPSSVTSPTPGPITSDQIRFRGNQRFRVHFGGPHARQQRRFVPVPVFYPVYDYPADYAAPPVDQPPASEADSSAAPAPGDEALREAYYQGAHDAIADQQANARYGSHYLDSREKRQPTTAQSDQKPSTAASDESKKEQRDDSPATVFIFKDGHKIETHNYAIVGQTLFDFTTKPLKKLQITDLDVDATRKANDELGISLTLP
jgi:hypothetical protein